MIGYTLNWVPSPNFTPGNQTHALYGRGRELLMGAGHWWNWPRSGATHDGVVSYMAQPSRQAAPHAVLSDRRVTEMVRPWDTAWCTGRANPYTYAIEVDPRIMFRWGYDNPSQAERELGNRIFETLAEYIADKNMHNMDWQPHNWHVPGTQCNPIHWQEVEDRAKQIWNEKRAPAPQPPKPEPAHITYHEFAEGVRKFRLNKQPTKLWNFNTTTWAGFGNGVKDFAEGELVDIKGYAVNHTLKATYLLTPYSFDKKVPNGFNEKDLNLYVPPAPQQPEWIRNLRDIEPVKLMVLPAAGTSIINLNDLSVIAPLAKGTNVDFVKATTVGGKEYLISSYSASKSMPNGILREHVGAPEVPKPDKPAWLEKWLDIENVTMYTRVEAPLVNLLDGTTIKMIPINTPIEVGSTTEWLEGKYAITEYSTSKKLAQGILIDHLDDEPIKQPDAPVEPAPQQPSIEDMLNWLERAVRAILEKLGIKL